MSNDTDTSNTSNNNKEEEIARMTEAIRFISNYYTTKDSTTNLAVNDIETTITNLVVMTHLLFTAVEKLIQIEMAKGSPITSVNRNLDELDDVLKRIYS
jgi:hypothetical protein